MIGRRVLSDEFIKLVERHRQWLAAATVGAPLGDGAQLSLVDAVISDIRLQGVDLANAELVRCTFEQVTLRRCDLSYATLLGSNFAGCQLLDCRLIKADLTDADFRGANLTDSDLTRADLTNADLRKADLTGCRLNWAWLIGTDLRGATLNGTNLDGTRIQAAKVFALNAREIDTSERTLIESIDLSEDGDGSKIVADSRALQAFRGDG